MKYIFLVIAIIFLSKKIGDLYIREAKAKDYIPLALVIVIIVLLGVSLSSSKKNETNEQTITFYIKKENDYMNSVPGRIFYIKSTTLENVDELRKIVKKIFREKELNKKKLTHPNKDIKMSYKEFIFVFNELGKNENRRKCITTNSSGEIIKIEEFLN